MTQSTPPGIGDLLGLFGGANPFGPITKSISQFQRGVSDFLSAVENFNKTMEQLHGVANRVNDLLDTVEEPIKAFVPQVTRTIKAADAMVEQLSAPIERVAPGLARLADLLAAPALTTLPTDLGEFMTVLSDLAHRLQPLGQMAETAGSMFGFRGMSALRSSAPLRPAPPMRPSRRRSHQHGRCSQRRRRRPQRRRPQRRRPRRRRPQQRGFRRRRPSPRRPQRRRHRRRRQPRRSAESVLGDERGRHDATGEPVPRTSTTTSVPTSALGGMNARAMPCPSTGEKLPLVTTPTA